MNNYNIIKDYIKYRYNQGLLFDECLLYNILCNFMEYINKKYNIISK